MIIIKVMGGLGNQMFQYAFARKLSLLKRVPLKLDVFWYSDIVCDENAKREYSLDNFNIMALDKATREDVSKVADKRGALQTLIRKMKKDVFNIDEFSFNPKYFKVHDDAYIEGFWQSEKYFTDIRDILLKEFTLKNGLSDTAKEICKLEAGCNSVSLHVRRGDYVTNKSVNNLLGSCAPEYYCEAVRTIREKVVDPHFFIYSDDITWVKDNLDIGSQATYISSPELKDYEELFLMSLCKHNIVANSSFSWWGGWLNTNADKFVIAPTRWFKTRRINAKDVVPHTWVKV